MTLTSYEIFKYSLALDRPFIVGGRPLSHREGLILRIVFADGICAAGEIAPLPGYSREDIKKANFQLNEVGRFLKNTPVPTDIVELINFLQMDFFQAQCPSVRFGVEMALLHRLSVLKDQLPSTILGCGSHRDISVAGLLQGTVEEIRSQASSLLSRGCRTYKLKVGSKNIPLDVKKLQTVRDTVGADKKIRLDANRSWGLMEAVTFAQSAGREAIEFIEEPVRNVQDLPVFYKETGWKVALDESLLEHDPDRSVEMEGVGYFVLKPMVIGGIIETLNWFSRAQKAGKQCVVSSCFESAVGGRMLADLSQLTPVDSGLGTFDWFKEDLLKPLVMDAAFRVPIEQLNFRWDDLDRSKLTHF